ncbi:Ig-like domain-containing protein [Streptomyces caniscabiei]|uniref:fibronectin type III domain-containing protein n=1 Tax=Streptomyces caniscabiei TaxID=2746961 RepID=UPI0029B888CC|nr:Ig-like domain-containing protein [Streptomyces caniscabiei]MDX2776129.1 Ig-like domain-containing protein [Streptomyces caniscabiei]
MNVPDATNNSYLLEVDGGACYVVGDGGIPVNTWTWVDYQNGNTSSKLTMNLSAGQHTFKAIGREPNVKFDRILFAADQNCLPTGFGNNCMVAADVAKPVTTITMPEDLSTVRGNVAIKATATDNTGIARVEFYIQNVLKATDTTSPYEYQWDTTTVADGTYTVTAKSYDAAGNNSFDAQSVTVKNKAVPPPSAPVAIKAVAPQPTQVVLSWQPGANTATDTRFRIVRNNVTVATVSGTSYTDNAVVAGTKYSYHVVAVDKDGNTSALPANPVTITTPAPPAKDTQAPTKPPKLVASVAGTSQINLTWQASSDNVGVRSYDVYRAEKTGAATKIATVAGTSFGNSNLKPNTAYTYYVIARDAAGNSSAASGKATATTKPIPAAPQRTSVIRGTVRSTTGRPIAGAKVMLWANGKLYQATTNWLGQYKISRLPAGSYQVKVKAKSYQTATLYTKISAGKTKWLDVTLRR